MGLRIDRERLVTLNIVGIVAGLIIFTLIFMPWISLFVNIPPLISIRQSFGLRDLNTIVSAIQAIIAGMPSPPPQLQALLNYIQQRSAMYTAVTATVIILLIIGGVVSFFHGFIGGGIALIGMLLLYVFVGDIFKSIDLLNMRFGIEPDIGFYLGWAAALLAIVSQLFRIKAPQLVSVTVFRGGRVGFGYYPREGETGKYGGGGITIPGLTCANCRTMNSPTATYCRKCGHRLI